ncbi:histidine phosphatase family protein [Photobacterium damselae]|uniref:histidine phosphatase family protein n=1 Tax=Photobacterium damselae TaxID=38293 RepID=UPI0040693669
MTIEETRVDFLRHGLPEGDKCLRGHTDFALTEVGFAQMEHAASSLKELDVIVTSPLQRCATFAHHIAQQFNLEVVEEPLWKEMNFGEWDGLEQQQLWQDIGPTIDSYWRDPWQLTEQGEALHKGETLEHFDARILQAWQTLVTQYAGKKILVVTHAGVMHQLLRHLLSMPKDTTYLHCIKFDYAARYRVTHFVDNENQQWPRLYWPPYID